MLQDVKCLSTHESAKANSKVLSFEKISPLESGSFTEIKNVQVESEMATFPFKACAEAVSSTHFRSSRFKDPQKEGRKSLLVFLVHTLRNLNFTPKICNDHCDEEARFAPMADHHRHSSEFSCCLRVKKQLLFPRTRVKQLVSVGDGGARWSSSRSVTVRIVDCCEQPCSNSLFMTVTAQKNHLYKDHLHQTKALKDTRVIPEVAKGFLIGFVFTQQWCL